MLELDGAGNRIREYTYLPGIDRPLAMRQWANGAGGAMYYYQLQAPGHVNGLVNAAGTLVNHYRYTPFGTPVAGFPVEGTPNPLQYMARELDSAVGLYYVRNRWYDPELGRFVSEDPIGLVGGINLYAYAENNPISRRDPYGLCFVGWSGGGTLGGVLGTSISLFWRDECSRQNFQDWNDGATAMYGVPSSMPRDRQHTIVIRDLTLT